MITRRTRQMKRQRRSYRVLGDGPMLHGQCDVCHKWARKMCGGCNGAFYCDPMCQRTDRAEHSCANPACDRARPVDVPGVRMASKNRTDVIRCLNMMTRESLRAAIYQLIVSEIPLNEQRDLAIKLVHAQNPCLFKDRACTDGSTLYISLDMLNTAHRPTAQEIGFELPRGVQPWAFIILHEFAHIVMKHPFNKELSTEVKETRADFWAAKFLYGK